MSTKLKGHVTETVKRPVHVVVCDHCGAEEPQRYGWLKLTWHFFDDNYGFLGPGDVEESPWDICSVACLTIFAESLILKFDEVNS